MKSIAIPYDDPTFQSNCVTREGHLATTVLHVQGIHCASCIQLIERSLGDLPGAQQVRANLTTNRVSIAWDDSKSGLSAFMNRLEEIGFSATPLESTSKQSTENPWISRLGAAGFGALATMFVGEPFYWDAFGGASGAVKDFLGIVSFAFTTPLFIYSAWPLFVNAWEGMKSKMLTMDTTIVIAALATYGASLWALIAHQGVPYFDSLMMFLFLILAGRAWEASVRSRVLSEVEGLMQQQPTVARCERDGSWVLLPASMVALNDRLDIRPGERVPVDALILSGQADIDEAILTGESLPVLRRAGDRLMGGSLNLNGHLIVRAESTHEHSTLSRLQSMVESAGAHRYPLAAWANRMGQIFLAIAILAAGLSWAIWYSLGLPEFAWQCAVATLVITCPCALGLAIPVSLTLAMLRGVREGYLLKSPAVLDSLRRVRHFVFDKTGTLTTGNLAMAQLTILNTSYQREDVLRLAASLEAPSEHPIAKAIVKAAEEQGIQDLFPVTRFTAIPGEGASGEIDGDVFRIGRATWALGESTSIEGVLLVGPSGAIASFALQANLRDEAPEVVRQLSSKGYQVTLLTGDNEIEAKKAAASLGLTSVIANVTPQDKLAVIRQLQENGDYVAMAGDGLNDAPALAQSDVGIAIVSGTDLSKQAADIVLLHDLKGLPSAIALAERTHRIIRGNLWLSLGYNAVAIPLAVAGMVTPLLAAILMPASSLLVLANALRLTKGESQS